MALKRVEESKEVDEGDRGRTVTEMASEDDDSDIGILEELGEDTEAELDAELELDADEEEQDLPTLTVEKEALSSSDLSRAGVPDQFKIAVPGEVYEAIIALRTALKTRKQGVDAVHTLSLSLTRFRAKKCKDDETKCPLLLFLMLRCVGTDGRMRPIILMTPYFSILQYVQRYSCLVEASKGEGLR